MDLSNLKSQRISPDTRLGIIDDFFDSVEYDVDEVQTLEDLDLNAFPYHARALCIYGTLLITKLHETAAEYFEPYYYEREKDAKAQLAQKSEFANLTERELEAKIREITMRDIRNCFSHGKFEISYTLGTNKLYFVLQPNQSKIVSNHPIVIPASAITRVIRTTLASNAYRYNEIGDLSKFLNSETLDCALKDIILPVQLMSFADYYLDKFKYPKNQRPYANQLYQMTQYVLLSSKICYDEDDYYKIFGRQSKIFETISLIRNSLAHDNTKYTDNATKMFYKDKDRNRSESLAESTAKLLIMDSQKEVLTYIMENEAHSEEAIEDLKDKLLEIFDFFFFNKDHTFEELYAAAEEAGLYDKGAQNQPEQGNKDEKEK